MMPWCINTGKSLIPLTLLFFAQKRNLLIPLELSGVMHQGSPAARNTLDSARIPRASKLLICGLFQKGRVLAQDEVRDFLQVVPAHGLRLRCQAPTLIIRETYATSTELLPEHSILFLQVFDYILLGPVDPPCEGQREELP